MQCSKTEVCKINYFSPNWDRHFTRNIIFHKLIKFMLVGKLIILIAIQWKLTNLSITNDQTHISRRSRRSSCTKKVIISSFLGTPHIVPLIDVFLILIIITTITF